MEHIITRCELQAAARAKKHKGRCVRLGVQRGSLTAFHTLERGQGIIGAGELLQKLWARSREELKEPLCQFPSFCIAVFLGCCILVDGKRHPDGRNLENIICRAPAPVSHTKSKPVGLKLNHNWQASIVGHPYFLIRFQLPGLTTLQYGFSRNLSYKFENQQMLCIFLAKTKSIALSLHFLSHDDKYIFY